MPSTSDSGSSAGDPTSTGTKHSYTQDIGQYDFKDMGDFNTECPKDENMVFNILDV